MEITVDLTEGEVQELLHDIHRYRYCIKQEEVTGKPPEEVFDLEVKFGGYQWLIEIVAHKVASHCPV